MHSHQISNAELPCELVPSLPYLLPWPTCEPRTEENNELTTRNLPAKGRSNSIWERVTFNWEDQSGLLEEVAFGRLKTRQDFTRMECGHVPSFG